MQKLNPGVKAKWVTALRSGDYRQGTLRLRWRGTGRDTYCCWGVLTDLYRKETGNGEWQGDSVSGYLFVDGDQEDSCGPTENVCKWAGVSIKDQSNFGVIGHLMGMNDEHKNTFPEIADWIEENL